MKKIANFPRLEELSIEDGPTLRSLIADYPPYSEFNFTNLFAWDANNVVQVSQFAGGLAILLQDHDTKRNFYTLIGSQSVDLVVKQLIEMSRQKGLGTSLRLVPQTVIDSLNNSSDFIIEEDRDNFDYILSVDYHAKLAGHKNANRRHLITKLVKENNTRLKVKQLDLTDHQDKSDILLCTSQWISASSKNHVKSEAELAAINRVLDSSALLNVRGLGFYIDDTICAFSLFEYLQNAMGIVHFEKCDLSYKGIAQYVRNCVAKEFLAHGVDYINYEQDLGIEGLRKAKSMLHPDSFLKKYTVSLKS
jgi:hypothetical protein